VVPRKTSVSWSAFVLFYVILLVVTGILDWANQLLAWRYTGIQIGLMTIGVVIFAVIGWRAPDLKAQQGVLLAFTVGVLTIVPGVLMSLRQSPEFWQQYFLVAFGMASGSFMGFLFVWFIGRFTSKKDE
jgi:multisubunit Na+/H+ antiporter MnhB subunit